MRVRLASPSDSAQSDSAQAFAQQVFDACVSEVAVSMHLSEHGPDLALAKAEAAQSRKKLARNVDRLGLLHLAVFRAIRMPESNAPAGVALDDELAAMRGAVVGSTQGDEVAGFVPAAFGAQLDVMHVQEDAVSASRNSTTPDVAGEDRSA